MSVHAGTTNSSVGDYSGDYVNVNTNLNMNILDNCQRSLVPVISSYGFHSVPDDNLTCVYSGPDSYASQVVLGYVNPCANTNPLVLDKTIPNAKDLDKGETEIFNKTGYALRMELDQMLVKWKTIQTKVDIGENTVKLMVEIYSQMLTLITTLNTYWQNTYNTHTHGSSPAPSQTVAVITPEANFTSLKGNLGDGSTCYVNDAGVIYTI